MECPEYDHEIFSPINCRKKIIFIHLLAHIDHFLHSDFGIRVPGRYFYEIFFLLARSTSFGLNRNNLPGNGRFEKKYFF